MRRTNGGRKYRICSSHTQLIKDMVGVSESTNWSSRSSAEAKYRALRCEIQLLDPASLEYADVRDHVLNSQDE